MTDEANPADPVESYPEDSHRDPEESTHEETAIESSILPSPLPPRPPRQEGRGPVPARFIATAAVVILVLGAIGFAAALRAQRLQAALAGFERVLVEGTPEEALEASRALPPAVRDDPTIALQIEELERRVAARAYLTQMGDFRTGLQAAKTYADRIRFCDQALTAQVEVVRIQAERARAAFHQRLALVKTASELDEALGQVTTDLSNARILNANPPWGRFLLARLRWRLRGPKAAEADLRRIPADPKTALGNLVAGLQAQVGGRAQEALSKLGRALQLDPRLADAYLFRGALRLERGNPRGAQQDAIKARELDPLSAEARLLLAECHLRHKDREAANAAVVGLLRDYPRDPFGLGFKAYLDITSGDPKRVAAAGAEARRATKLNPTSDWALLALSEDARAGGAIRANALIDKALRMRPRLEGFLLRARHFLARGQVTQALQDLTLRVLRRDPKNVEGLLLSIQARTMARQYDQALRLVARLQTVKESAEAFYWQGRILLTKRPRNLRRATEALTQAIALDPKHSAAYAHRAEAYSAQRQYVSALADLDTAQKLGAVGGIPAWRLSLLRGSCHEALGEKNAAIRAYRAFLNAAPRGHSARGWVQGRLRQLLR